MKCKHPYKDHIIQTLNPGEGPEGAVLALKCTACGAGGFDYEGGVQVFGGPLAQAFRRPSIERTRSTFAIVMLVLSALAFLVTNSGWAMAAFGVQSSLTTWALHEWWLAQQRRHKRR